jgi:5-methylcytosine-specific restriction endonuclease McrA
MGAPRLPVWNNGKKKKRLPNDLIGMRFGQLTVIRQGEKQEKGQSGFWICKCDCGKIKPIRRLALVKGVSSCGCLRTKAISWATRLRPYEALYNGFCRKNVKKHDVELTYEEFLCFVVERVCHYCGADLVWTEFDLGINGHAYNLDRKDNSIGYSLTNCVPCCGRCNRGKGGSFTYDEWYEMTRCLREKKYIVFTKNTTNSG